MQVMLHSITSQYKINMETGAFRAQSTVDFPIGGHVNVLSDYKETGPEKKI